MRLLVTSLVLISGTFPILAQPAGQEDALAEAKKKWGEHFRAIDAVSSRHLKEVFQDTAIYRATVYNPMTVIAGRPTFLHAIIMKEKSPVFIEDDAAAAKAVSAAAVKVADVHAALSRVTAFAELRSYDLRLQGAEPTIEVAKKEGWKMTIVENTEGWVVSCVFVTDPNITCCERYEIAVSRSGEITSRKKHAVSMLGGYK